MYCAMVALKGSFLFSDYRVVKIDPIKFRVPK